MATDRPVLPGITIREGVSAAKTGVTQVVKGKAKGKMVSESQPSRKRLAGARVLTAREKLRKGERASADPFFADDLSFAQKFLCSAMSQDENDWIVRAQLKGLEKEMLGGFMQVGELVVGYRERMHALRHAAREVEQERDKLKSQLATRSVKRWEAGFDKGVYDEALRSVEAKRDAARAEVEELRARVQEAEQGKEKVTRELEKEKRLAAAREREAEDLLQRKTVLIGAGFQRAAIS